jgi:hypothetical protein
VETAVTPEALKTLIESDQQATVLINAGNDYACASRCSEIAPVLNTSLPLSIMGILNLYQDNLALGGLVIATIKQVASVNPIIGEMLPFMGPSAHQTSMPDFGLPAIRQALVTPVEWGGIGLTQEQAAPILRAGESSQTITALEVEFVRTRLWQR